MVMLSQRPKQSKQRRLNSHHDTPRAQLPNAVQVSGLMQELYWRLMIFYIPNTSNRFVYK